MLEEMDTRHGAEPGIAPDLAAFGPMVTVLTSLIVKELVRYATGIAPPVVIGRVVIITRLIGFCVIPVAPIIGGAIFSATGLFWPVLLIAGAIQVGVGAIAMLTPVRAIQAPDGELGAG